MLANFTHVLAIELTLISEGNYRCVFALVLKNGNSLEASDYTKVEGSLVKIIEKLPRNYPTAITLNGKGIVHRSFPDHAVEREKLFVTAFPALDKQDFYIQQVVEEQLICVSLVRRSFADDILGKLKFAGLKVFILGLGGLSVVSIWGLLDNKAPHLSFCGHQFEQSSHLKPAAYKFGQYEDKVEKVKLANAEIASPLVVPYALAFQLFMTEQLTPIAAAHEGLALSLGNFLENAKLKRMGSLFVIGLLVLLLISFVVLMHFNRENSSLSERVGKITSTADQASLIKSEVDNQELMLLKLGWNGGYNRAFILSEIGASKPRALVLEKINFRSPKGVKEKAIQPYTLIDVKGETNNLTAVNNWIFMLKEKKWVLNVSLLRYQQSNNSESFAFELLIEY
jgi:hypothetical protein